MNVFLHAFIKKTILSFQKQMQKVQETHVHNLNKMQIKNIVKKC